MRIRAVVFDIGQTLCYYPLPLNWSRLYRPAFEEIEKRHGLRLTEDAYEHIGRVLTKYNTRINPGLPPTPICNPGMASIQAALNPMQTDYYYYALDAEEGVHKFFRDYNSFTAFVAEQNYEQP